MNDLISRQAAIDAIRASTLKYTGFMEMEMYTDDDAVEAIEDLPSAQPEIIHCRDCKYWQDQQEGVIEISICARPENKYEKLPFRFMIGEDGFCSYAERRTDDSIPD